MSEHNFKPDAVMVEIIGNLMMSIAEETCLSIIKSAYSTNIKERRDVSSAVVGPDGSLVAQADYLPLHLNAFLTVVPYIYEHYGRENILDGDIFIVNDPYHGGGNHLPDIVLAEPVFGESKIIGWIVNMAHHSDIGGMVPGSTSSTAVSLFQEGIRIPAVRICNAGKMNEDVLNIILGNTRTRIEREGDLTAQISSNHVGARRLRDAYEKYGENLIVCLNELCNYSERRMRTAIRNIPDGIYSYSDYLDDGGKDHPDPVLVSVDINVHGDSLTFDFSKTDGQVNAPINVSYNSLLACCFYSLKVLFGADIPATSGIFRVFDINAPLGSLVNPREPAPLGLTINAAQRIPDVILGALASVAQDRVVAGCNSTCQTTVFTCADPSRPGSSLICHEAIGGGSGASKHADGLSGVQVHMTNTSNMPIEAMETEFPIIMIKKYALRTDSGGAGEFRGGLGIQREFRVMADDIALKATGDRQKFPPYGLEGGHPGASGSFYRSFEGKTTHMPGKSTGNVMQKGEVVIVNTPGAGGYGNPLFRDPQKVVDDVENGYVSLEKALKEYGVVIQREKDGIYQVDLCKTDTLRKKMIKERK